MTPKSTPLRKRPSKAGGGKASGGGGGGLPVHRPSMDRIVERPSMDVGAGLSIVAADLATIASDQNSRAMAMVPASPKEVATACRARRGTILCSQTVLMPCPSETVSTASDGGSVRDNLEHEVLVADGSSAPLIGVGVRRGDGRLARTEAQSVLAAQGTFVRSFVGIRPLFVHYSSACSHTQYYVATQPLLRSPAPLSPFLLLPTYVRHDLILTTQYHPTQRHPTQRNPAQRFPAELVSLEVDKDAAVKNEDYTAAADLKTNIARVKRESMASEDDKSDQTLRIVKHVMQRDKPKKVSA